MLLGLAVPGSEDQYIAEFYITIRAGEELEQELEVAASDFSRMSSLMAQIEAGDVVATITPTAAELASGFLSAPRSVQANDLAPVDATALLSGMILLRKSFTGLVTGAADDVTIYALDALPSEFLPKFRVVLAWAVLTAATGGSTLALWSRAAAAGTKFAVMGSAAVGMQMMTDLNAAHASSVLEPAATEGLFLRRSDRAVAGEVFILIKREN